MKKTVTNIMLTTALFVTTTVGAANFERSATEFVGDMKVGINIGNTLDVPLGNEVEWGNDKIKPELFKLYKKKGFDVVRIPISWRRQFDRNDPNNTVKPEFMARIKEVVDWSLAEGFTTIINIHHDGGDDGWPGAWLTIDGEHEEQAKKILANIWKQVSLMFRNYDEKLVFEAFNEVRKAKKYAGVNGNQKGHEDWTGNEVYCGVINDYAKVFYDVVRGTGGNNAKRYLMIPTYAAAFSEEACKFFKLPNPNDNHLIATIHCYEPGDFCIWGNRKAYDKNYVQSRLNIFFPRFKKYFTDRGIPLILGEINADLRYYDAEHYLDNDDARVRWIGHYVREAKKYGFPCILWESGGSERMGAVDRFNIKWTREELVDAFVGTAKGKLTEADCEKLAQKVKKTIENVYEKNDYILKWNVDNGSYDCWGQTLGGFDNLNGNRVTLRFMKSDKDGNLYVNTNGKGGNMLHQQFWADKSVTATRTFKSYVMTHDNVSLKGKKLVFTLTAKNGTTCIINGDIRLPGVKNTLKFGADIGKEGCIMATPNQPKVTVEIPLTEGEFNKTMSGGVSIEMKMFPGNWGSNKPLDAVISPIRLCD